MRIVALLGERPSPPPENATLRGYRARMRVFDDVARTDDTPQRAGEDTFAFLNRVADVYFGRVRDVIERWFAHVPAAEQPGLRGRLRANAEANSAPAFIAGSSTHFSVSERRSG